MIEREFRVTVSVLLAIAGLITLPSLPYRWAASRRNRDSLTNESSCANTFRTTVSVHHDVVDGVLRGPVLPARSVLSAPRPSGSSPSGSERQPRVSASLTGRSSEEAVRAICRMRGGLLQSGFHGL